MLSAIRNAKLVIGALLLMQALSLGALFLVYQKVERARGYASDAARFAEIASVQASDASESAALAECRTRQIRNEQSPALYPDSVTCGAPQPNPTFNLPNQP